MSDRLRIRTDGSKWIVSRQRYIGVRIADELDLKVMPSFYDAILLVHDLVPEGAEIKGETLEDGSLAFSFPVWVTIEVQPKGGENANPDTRGDTRET